jgi:hypothetical protein
MERYIPKSITTFYRCPGKCRKEDLEGYCCDPGRCDYEHPPEPLPESTPPAVDRFGDWSYYLKHKKEQS